MNNQCGCDNGTTGAECLRSGGRHPVQNSYNDAITQEKLRPAGMPKIDPLEAELGHGLVYTAKFEVMPEIELVAVEELSIEKPVCEIVEEDTEKMIETLRKQRQKFNVVERETKIGDKVKIDFKGEMDGEVFEGGEASDFELELGSNSLIPGFEDGLVGKKAGDEVTLDLNFPDPYQKKEFAGKPVKFLVTVHEVKEAVLPRETRPRRRASEHARVHVQPRAPVRGPRPPR